MPLPQGFVLEPPPQQPKLPEGFVLEGQQPSAVLNQNKTPLVPPLSEEELQRVMSPQARQLRQKSLAGQAMVAPPDQPTTLGGTLQGIGQDVISASMKAAGQQDPFYQTPQTKLQGLEEAGKTGIEQAFHPINYLFPGAYGAVAKLSPLLAKLGLFALSAKPLGQAAGVVSPGSGATPGERTQATLEGGASLLGASPVLLELLNRSRLNTLPPPPPKEPLQLRQPTRFYGGSSASPVIDASHLSPNELTEAQRLAQANATMQERQLADIASKKKYGGEIPIIGQGPVAPKPVSLQQQFTPTGELIKSSELETQPKEVQGGQVSFSGEAKAGAIPSARQTALEDVRPAVRTMDNKIYVGAKGDSHNDIITKNNLSPTMIDRRMFVDGKGNPISREDLAKQGVPGEPTSVPGAHSTGLTKVQEDPRLADLARYNELSKVFAKGDMDSPEFMSAWQEREQIKNKYGGHTPDTQEAIDYAKNVRTNQGQPKEAGVQDQGRQENSGGNVQQTQGKQETSYEAKPIVGGEPQRLHSGIPVPEEVGKYAYAAGRAFVSQAEKILRDPQAIGFSATAQVDAEQLKNRLRNKVGAESTEWKMMQDAGIDKVKGKMTAQQMAEWVKENGPRVEVRKFGEGGQTDEQRFAASYRHNWYDSLPQRLQSTADGYVNNVGHPVQQEAIAKEFASEHGISKEEAREQLEAWVRSRDVRLGQGQSHWQSIAPKPESQMPGYVEIAVVKPIKHGEKMLASGRAAMRSNDPNDISRQEREAVQSEQFPSSHSFPPNTLGFLRGYMEMDAKTGEKTFHVIEVQSDWEKRLREQEDEESLHSLDKRTKGDPLLPHYERLALKAAIDHARREGATRIAISDAETAMMTEGHDRVSLEPNEDLDLVQRYNSGELTRQQFQEQIEQLKLSKRPSQEPGMRLHYDRTLSKIAEELTGEKGEKVGFGKHKMAVAPHNDNWYVTTRTGAQRGPYDTREEASRSLKEGESIANDTGYRKDLIFRNEAGQPKTDVTARSYPIAKPKERLESGEPQTTTGRTYGGIPFLAPEFYTPLIKDIKIGANKASEGLSNLLEKGKLTEAISQKFNAIRGVSQHVANQLSENIRGPIERTFGKKDRDLAEQALSLVRESKENKATLQGQYDRRGELSGLPKWQERWSKAAQFALSNWDKLVPISQRYQAYTDQVLSRLSDVDRPVERRAGYVRHLPESSDNVTGFRRAREFETFFDRIKAGSDPKSLNSVDLLKSTIYDAHRSYIQSKAFNDWMTKIKTPDGKPLAKGVKDYEKVERGKGRQPDIRPPSGYVETTIGGQRVAIQKDYAGLLKRLTDSSSWDNRAIGRAAQELAGTAKHVVFGIDIVHLARMLKRDVFAKLSVGQLPMPSGKKGILSIDYSPQELKDKAENGDFPKKWLPELLEKRRINNGLVEEGFNIGHYDDAIRQKWTEKIWVTGHVQKFIFGYYTRAAMSEVGPITYRLYKEQYPSLSDREVMAKTAKDLNFLFANLGKQGWFKSASTQDTLRVFVLAPHWTEATPRLEAQAIGGFLKGATITAKNVVTKGPLKVAEDPSLRPFNIQSRTLGTMALAYLFFNQVINMATTGHSTLENEEGHKLDAWIPLPHGGGYWVGPEAAAFETMHRIEQVANKSETVLEGIRSYIDPKLTPLSKGIATGLTGHKYGLTGPLVPKNKQLEQAVKNTAPVPILYSGLSNPDQRVPQVLRSIGLEGDVALSDRQKMYQAAREWMQKNNVKEPEGQFPESPYQPLNDALRKGDVQGAKVAYERLKGEVRDEYIQKYYKNITNRGFAGSEENDKAFRASLSPDQQAIYDRAKTENEKVKAAFFQMLGEKEPPAAKEKSKSKRQKKFKLFGE